jgi:hypothetical protein
MKRITVKWNFEERKILLEFDLYTDTPMDSINRFFWEWIDKTKIFTPESLCRYIRKKVRKIRIFSENQYLNYAITSQQFKTGYKKYF